MLRSDDVGFEARPGVRLTQHTLSDGTLNVSGLRRKVFDVLRAIVQAGVSPTGATAVWEVRKAK